MIAARLSPRWRKLVGDTRVAYGRLCTMFVAMSMSIAAVTALLVGNDILARELPRNYLSSNPASATLTLESVDEDLLSAVRTRPGIVDAQSSATVFTKVESKAGEWLPLVLFVVPDFTVLRINTFTSQSGAWPPPGGSMLVERDGLSLLGSGEGATVTVDTSQGVRRSLLISGVVHDPRQAPSTQEGTIYGYITPATLSMLDESRKLDLLNIVVTEAGTVEAIETIARSLAAWLRTQRREVSFIDIPPPGEHSHQWQYDTVLLLLLSFSLLGLVLEAIVMSIIIAGLLAPQVRQIAVMKAIGARTTQIAALYSSVVGIIALAAVAVGVPLGIYAGHELVDFAARVLNLIIAGYELSWWIVGASVVLGVLLPLIAALVPILVATRRTVRESLNDYGVSRGMSRMRMTNRLVGWFRHPDPMLHLAIRNTVRRRAKLALTMSLLAIAGVAFIAGGNLLALWENVTAEAAASRRYDMQIGLRAEQNRSTVLGLISGIAGVRSAEAYDYSVAVVDSGDHFEVTATDDNSLLLHFIEARTTQLAPKLFEGRWLQPGESDAVVLNSGVRHRVFPDVELGDTVALLVHGRPVRLRVVGISRDAFSRAAGYTTRDVIDRVRDKAGVTRSIRVALTDSSSTRSMSEKLTQTLERESIGVRFVTTNEFIARNEDAHTYVIVVLIGLIVLSVAVVGTFSLASALSTSMIERTREVGIMRTLGASSSHIVKSVVSEAVVIGFTSWLIAVLLSVPLTVLIVNLLRSMMPQPLSLVWSAAAPAAWLVLMLLISAAAGVYPAKRAARLTVGEALAHT